MAFSLTRPVSKAALCFGEEKCQKSFANSLLYSRFCIIKVREMGTDEELWESVEAWVLGNNNRRIVVFFFKKALIKIPVGGLQFMVMFEMAFIILLNYVTFLCVTCSVE